MNLAMISEAFMNWCSVIAKALLAAFGGLKARQNVRLVEADHDCFTVEVVRGGKVANAFHDRVRIVDGKLDGALPGKLLAALRGSKVELVLKPDRFLFRPLELPKRASEFLGGIVRAQIDRLTPWTAREAVFGWSRPNDIGKDRIVLTVVATAQTLIEPYLRVLTDLGAGAIAISTIPQGESPTEPGVEILQNGTRLETDIRRVRNAVAAVFVVMAILAGLAVTLGQFATDSLDVERQDLSSQISRQRALLRSSGAESNPELHALERRKRENPMSVLIIEALSQVLPDHTYLTELRIEADKLQLIGITRDAPSLVRLIEQSPHFTRATFFAPTTRMPDDPGERFHIEAHISPVFAQRT
jgi:general secretion pathway protein L